ncbi:E3 ubiquitin/ISG15 ligase TRIM25-like [Scleropages formosus]|uniref:E3 ubiquitin/ISG15 ligase TRIM25-like n=1 Tax=Scleropages formosus TaxID=113540 RepID=UPI0008784E85|nr:E3 ubiquitin/ISG15 ligase TRIM25-like [Scleropages formosus]
MAQAGNVLERDQFICSICLDLLKDPVTIPCGHSYCMDCIKDFWDQNDHFGVYSCPQCRQTFSPRPVLGRNTILAEVVEKLKTQLQAAPPDHSVTGPVDVDCDVCTETKNKAIKSCLTYLASYCENHLKLHNELNPGNRHELSDATRKLQDKMCSHHEKLLEFYCRTDQQCICYLCAMDQHRGHDTVPVAAGRIEKQVHIEDIQRKLQQKIQQSEKKVQELRQAVDSLTHSAQAAMEDTESIFTQLIRSLEKRCTETIDVIRAQESAAVCQAVGLLEQLEKEIAELKRRDSEMEQLSHTEDPIFFLLDCQSVCAPLGTGDIPSITVNPFYSFEKLKKDLSDLKAHLEQSCKNKLGEISQAVKEIHIMPVRRTNTERLTPSGSVDFSEGQSPTVSHIQRPMEDLQVSNRAISTAAYQLARVDFPPNPLSAQLNSRRRARRRFWEAD